MSERKETANRDTQGVRKPTYKRFKEGKDFTEVEAAQTSALCDMMRAGIFGKRRRKRGRG